MTVILVVVLTFLTWRTASADKEPAKCCSPDQWEARVLNIGSTYRQQYYYNNMDVRLTYDYTGQRWAIVQIHPDDASQTLKLVYNHYENKRYAIKDGECYVTGLHAPMAQYCIPGNSTYAGRHVAASGGITFDSWTFDFFFFPLRQTVAVTRDGCLPLKEVSFGLVQNTWRWSVGDEACIPWEDPEVVVAGQCYKSFHQRVSEYMGTSTTSPMANMDFYNVNLTISDESIFSLPDNCTELEGWGDRVKLNDFWRVLIMRMKYYDFHEEVGKNL